MYAIIQTGGKQYKVQKGDKLLVEKLDGTENSHVTLSPLLVSDGEHVKVGNPVVAGAAVIAQIAGEEKGEKLRIFKMKRRKGYRRNTGHRQSYTVLQITDIQATA